MNVVEISKWKKRNEVKDERSTLLVNRTTGKITSAHPPRPEFGDRLDRIKTSLQKISQLMAELRRMEDGPLGRDDVGDRDLD